MYEYSLEEVFEEINRREFAKYNSPMHHFFSFRHRREVRKILRQYAKSNYFKSQSERCRIPLRRRLLIVAVIIFLAVIVFRVAGFSGTVYTDNTHMFALNDRNAPKVVEELYYLDLPSSYNLTEEYGNIGDGYIRRIYTSNESGRSITFFQYTKCNYDVHFDNEHSEFFEIKINGCNGFIWQPKNAEDKETHLRAIAWDNGNYIFEVSGKINKDELANLAKSTKLL